MSPTNDYAQLEDREGRDFSPQPHRPMMPPQIPARQSSTPRREPLKVPMPALPLHMLPLSSSPDSPEPEDSQNSVEDLIAEARRIAFDNKEDEEKEEKKYDSEYEAAMAQIKPKVDNGKGKGKGTAILTPPRPVRLPPSPPLLSLFGEYSQGDGTVQDITPVEVIASSTPRSSSSSVYSTTTLSNRGSPSPQPSRSSNSNSSAGASNFTRQSQQSKGPSKRRELKTFEQPMQGRTPWLTAPEVDAAEEGERMRQKNLRARREAEERERVRKEKKAAEKAKKAAEKAVEKEKKLTKKSSKGSLFGLRRE
ncbi:hypothetical protein PGQ11_011545 [Apiospora arundinis]|uniref:Uncharacterized protein n=1 Tax=Apiospora arundinis TaxID=335852 RepID=A0ABR2I0I3_9PEZI